MIDFWMKKDKTPNGYYAGLVAKVYQDGGYSVRIANNDKIGFLIHNGIPDDYEIVYSNTNITDTFLWHHIVCVWLNKTIYIYIDDMNSPDITKYLGLYPIGDTYKWLDIGNDWPTDNENPFDGKIDELKISIIKEKEFSNNPPSIPRINGPSSGKPGSIYTYTFISIDPDGDNVFYEIDWGDGQVNTWYGPHASNTIITRSHVWKERGTFKICARAKDDLGIIGNWGEYIITMPKDKMISSSLFLRFLERYPMLNRLLNLVE